MGNFDNLKLNNQLCFPLYAASRYIVNLYAPILKPYGLTYTQYLIFLVLWEKDNLQVGDLCRILHLDTGTITPVLKKLAVAGWIERTRSLEDERVVNVVLTEKGRNFKNEAKTIPDKINSGIAFSESDTGELYRLLYKLLENVK